VDVGGVPGASVGDPTVDIHCVTKWTKLDTRWRGVSVDTLLSAVNSEAGYLTAWSDGGCTTNLALEDVTGGWAWVAFEFGGGRLESEHAGPARLLVPHLYFLEEPEVGTRTDPDCGRRTGVLADLRLSQSRRPVAGAALPRRLNWQLARVVELDDETARTKSLVLDVPDWDGHRAGQHVDVRLTAEDGYQAQRSYSIASAPEDPHLVLTVERLDDGEVSPYLTDVLIPGDELELRGPIGGYFIWEESLGGPLLLIAGGSGVAPFRAMLRHWSAAHSSVPTRLLYSSRSLDDLIYQKELLDGVYDGVEVRIALTRQWPEDWQGHRGRIDGELLQQVAWAPTERPLVYICGPTGFVEAAAQSLVAEGHDPRRVKTERFGPTGT
jgi:ferredoxin-NADP reductase